MRQPKSWTQRLQRYLGMENESMPLQSVLELCGDKRVLIENHSGVTEYGPNKISVQVRYGEISVTGAGLRLCRMLPEQLVIAGRIDSIVLMRGRK